MRDGAIIVNNFVHDLATGFWLALVLVSAGLRRVLAATGLLAAGRPVLGLAFRWLLVSLAIILLTGAVRAVTYREPGVAGRDQVKLRLLVAKHVLLGAAFLAGTFWAYRLAFA
ncbi:MAG: hypothetical protein ACM3RP_12720 [Chitinophagales bacterium]